MKRVDRGDQRQPSTYQLRGGRCRRATGPEPSAGLADEKAIPEPKRSVARGGDLWVLGEHRLLCDDSTSAEDVTRLMDGKRAARTGRLFNSSRQSNLAEEKVEDGHCRKENALEARIISFGFRSGRSKRRQGCARVITKVCRGPEPIAHC